MKLILDIEAGGFAFEETGSIGVDFNKVTDVGRQGCESIEKDRTGPTEDSSRTDHLVHFLKAHEAIFRGSQLIHDSDDADLDL